MSKQKQGEVVDGRTTVGGREHMEDSMGRLVPTDMVSEINQLRDKTVREMVEKAEDMSGRLRALHVDLMGTMYAFAELSAERYKVKVGGKKGNLTLTTYDGKYRVRISISDHMVLNEGIQAAKALIDECIGEWVQGSRDEIQVLIQDAFQTDKEGNLNTRRILSLRDIEIDDSRWKMAMKAISESYVPVGSKPRLYIHKKDENGEFKMVPMGFARM